MPRLSDDLMLIELEIRQIRIINDLSSSQEVILAEKNGNRILAVYVGFYEANIIDNSVNGRKSERPMAHDLIYNITDAINYAIKYVMIDDLIKGVFYGKLVIGGNNDEDLLIDCRPSDALVLAVKRSLPIFVEDHVINEVGIEINDV